jgi:ankyrin repeat protein
MWAAIHEAPAVAMSLVAALADLEARDALGWTALHHAVHSGSAQMVAVLHYLGADFSARTEEGDSVQHLAVLSNAGVMLQLLSPATSDWNIRDASGHTPLQVAVARGCMAALTTLLALKADANVKDSHEQSLFALGTVQGHEDVVRALVSPIDPPQHSWEEEHLTKVLDKLPWVDSDVVDDECSHKLQRSHSSASSVCSGSTLSSSASVRNNKLGRGLASRALAKKTGMHTITEVDSEAGSTLSTGEEKRRPSKGSQQRPSSADSRVSHGSIRSNATHKSVAKSVRSTKSGAASVQSGARSTHSFGSVAKSTQSLVSLHSKVGSKVSVTRSHVSGMSRASGQSRISRGSRSTGNRVSSTTPTIYSAAVTVIDRSPVSLMSAANKRCLRSQLPAPISLAAALATEDKNGCKPLALAAQARHAHLVSLLLEFKAAPNSPDLRGNTALLLAAAAGDKESVLLLLDANAIVDAQNAEGLQAGDVATSAEIRQILQERLDRTAVAKKLGKSFSLPALVKPPADKAVSRSTDVKSSTFRLRLDGLPLRVQAEDIEKDLFDILRRNRIPRPLQMEVVVDPITLLSRGHGFMFFASREQCEAAEECVVDEFDDPCFTSIDEVKA